MKYAYYFVEGYVVRWRRPGNPEWLAPDGQWRDYSSEWDVIMNGRQLADEQEALETAEMKFEQNRAWWDEQYPQYRRRDGTSE